jgi:hypothetical protein
MDKRAWKGGPDGGYRDRLLSFQWQLPPDLIEALRLPTARNGAHEVARRMIVAEALLGAERGQGVSYSRRKLSYSRGKRYRFQREAIPSARSHICNSLGIGGQVGAGRVACR